MQTHRALILAVAASAVVLSACGQQSGDPAADPAAAGAASVSGTTTAAPAAPAVRAVEVGDRFSGPGTFRVGRGLTGTPIAIPAGRYRLYFGTDLATGADYTAGTWMRCSELPCEPRRQRQRGRFGGRRGRSQDGRAAVPEPGRRRDGRRARHDAGRRAR